MYKLGHICMTEILFPLLNIFLYYTVKYLKVMEERTAQISSWGMVIFFLCGYYTNVLHHPTAVPLAEILFSRFIAMATPTTTEKSNSMKMDVKTLSKPQMRFTFVWALSWPNARWR